VAQPQKKKKKPPMNPRAKAQRLDMLIGILGFFTAIAFASAVVQEVQGNNAVAEAITLAAFCAGLWLAIRARRDVFR
jgi:hypothetical protein